MGPVIGRCPESRRVVEEVSAKFTVEASGTEPLSYQWKKESKPIAGATNATYRNGAVAWEQPLTGELARSRNILYLVGAGERLALVGSRVGAGDDTQYLVECRNAATGQVEWTGSHAAGQPGAFTHGEQVHHPVVLDDLLVAEPVVYDLATGGWIPIQYDERNDLPVLPPELRADVVAEVRAQEQLRSPDGRPVWFEGGTLCREQVDGTVVRQEYAKCLLRPAGHGFSAYGAQERYYDFLGRPMLEKKERRHDSMAWVVRDSVVFLPAHGRVGWSQRSFGGEVRVRLFDLTGRMALEDIFDPQSACTELDVRALPDGMYFYEIWSEGRVARAGKVFKVE